MAFELPKLPFPTDANGVPYIASPDTAGNYAAASGTHVKNASGLWVPVSDTDPMPTKVTGSNMSQVLISETLDFKGKTAGQTFDVPHVARFRTGVLATTNDPVYFTEFNSTTYSFVASSDGVCHYNTTTTNGTTAQHLFSFDILAALKLKGRIPLSWTVDQLKAALKGITVTWVGYGVGADGGVVKNGATVKWWNATSSVWRGGDSNTASSPTAIVRNDKWMALEPSHFVDASGSLHVLAHSTYPSNGTLPSTIYTDYVKVDVQLSVEALLVSNPLTYDPVNRATRVMNRSRTVVDTVVNAASVAAGGYLDFDMGVTDETEILALVNIDKQPWSLASNTPWSANMTFSGTFFPERSSVTTAYSSTTNPAASLFLGINANVNQGLAAPTTMQEARGLIVPPAAGTKGRLTNGSAETATVTIRLVRVWR